MLMKHMEIMMMMHNILFIFICAGVTKNLNLCNESTKAVKLTKVDNDLHNIKLKLTVTVFEMYILYVLYVL